MTGVRASLLEQARLLHINTGRRVPPENFHITLVFLGNVEEQAIAALTGAAEGMGIPGFRLQINHGGWWKRAKVAWLAPAYTRAPLKPCTFEPIHWDVREFCLVESVTHEKGARYRVLRTWGLAWQDSVVELRAN